MGTYIKNPKTGEEFKLCTADNIHYRHDQVSAFLANGWEKAGDLRSSLFAPRSLFEIEAYLTEEDREILKRMGNYTHRRARPLVIVNTIQGEQPIGEKFDHNPVIVQLQRLRSAVYVYTGLECKQTGHNVHAQIAGFRLNEAGTTRTIFECDNCAAFFSLGEKDAELVKKDNPGWAHLIKANPAEQEQ